MLFTARFVFMKITFNYHIYRNIQQVKTSDYLTAKNVMYAKLF